MEDQPLSSLLSVKRKIERSVGSSSSGSKRQKIEKVGGEYKEGTRTRFVDHDEYVDEAILGYISEEDDPVQLAEDHPGDKAYNKCYKESQKP